MPKNPASKGSRIPRLPAASGQAVQDDLKGWEGGAKCRSPDSRLPVLQAGQRLEPCPLATPGLWCKTPLGPCSRARA